MNMKQKTTDELDEQSKRLIENLHKLSNQEQEEFYVAFCEPDDKYEAMMQAMEDGHWKRKLTELRENRARRKRPCFSQPRAKQERNRNNRIRLS